MQLSHSLLLGASILVSSPAFANQSIESFVGVYLVQKSIGELNLRNGDVVEIGTHHLTIKSAHETKYHTRFFHQGKRQKLEISDIGFRSLNSNWDNVEEITFHQSNLDTVFELRSIAHNPAVDVINFNCTLKKL